jgi:methylglutaconyl-CoA hydratase
MRRYIERLSKTIRSLRRLDAIVVAAVQGSAIAGGCALLTGCDFVFVNADAKLGYPVHQIGVSPAVTIPTLQQSIGMGRARSLLMSGAVVSGERAVELGLASHLVKIDENVVDQARQFCEQLGRKGPIALRATKQWLNELDGSLDDDRFDSAVVGSAALCDGDEAHLMLTNYWQSRTK